VTLKDHTFIVKISEAAPPPSSWTTTYTYTYDANRLADVNGVAYTWDDNGNLLSDGVNTYTYDHANRLVSVAGPSSSSSFAYNGLGDRLQGTVDGVTTNYSLDLNSWRTQVLADGTNTYLYGATRIAQYDASGAEYFLADGLGSVRQLVDNAGGVQLSKVYEPFGGGLNSSGAGATNYGFTGEWTDGSIELLYLRSRYYSLETGRFLTKDSWPGDFYRPLTLNGWNYVDSNPVNFVDPSGRYLCAPGCCEEWVDSALAQLTVYGGPFSHFVVDMFDFMDSHFHMFIFFISKDTGAAPIPYMIIMPKSYIDSSLLPSNGQVAHFAHEVVHQTQTTDRYTTWGEAQAYIYSGKILEELGGESSPLEKEIYFLAYDIDSPGLTTRDLHKLCQVRKELVTSTNILPYRIFPNLINYLVFPQWYTYCEP
jgi:RHS repeat-associated protein